jgi:hypothetical protein
MRLKTSSDEWITLNVFDNNQSTLINYNLIKLSYNNYISVDRGGDTDRYSSEMKFFGSKDYISTILNEIYTLRNNQLPIIIDQCEENFFGEHIDHSGELEVTLFAVGKQSSKNFNMYEVGLEFILNGPIYKEGSGLPSALHCLQSGWEGYSDWGFVVNETYNRENYFVDKENDTYQFKGRYILNLSETSDLLNYWRVQRGSSFLITESQFGTSDMFGATVNSNTHNVIIKNIEVNRFSPISREVIITLLKVSQS